MLTRLPSNEENRVPNSLSGALSETVYQFLIGVFSQNAVEASSTSNGSVPG